MATNTNLVYVGPSAHGTTSVVNFNSANKELNEFLSKFDIWGSKGLLKAIVGGHARWFEAEAEFCTVAQGDMFKNIFRRMGAEVVTEYPLELG